MSYYKADRIERKNRRKAIVITAMLYLGGFAFFIMEDDINWKDYIPSFVELATDQSEEDNPEVISATDVRP